MTVVTAFSVRLRIDSRPPKGINPIVLIIHFTV